MSDFIHVEGDQYLGLAAVVYAVPAPFGNNVQLVLSKGETITVPTERLAQTFTAAEVAERLTRRGEVQPETKQRVARIVAEADARNATDVQQAG